MRDPTTNKRVHPDMQARGQATAVTGLAYDNTYCIVARITDGQIREMTDYVDTELITRALFGAPGSPAGKTEPPSEKREPSWRR
jgi:ketosteroid isomerase-like protein